jgi:hypothetical protein
MHRLARANVHSGSSERFLNSAELQVFREVQRREKNFAFGAAGIACQVSKLRR